MQQQDSIAEQAAVDMSSLIPEYRSTLARMKKQVDELQVRLEDACKERNSLHHQVSLLLNFAHVCKHIHIHALSNHLSAWVISALHAAASLYCR